MGNFKTWSTRVVGGTALVFGAASLLLATPGSAQEAEPAVQGGVVKVTICHATASFTNPYTNPSVDISAVDGEGNNDHSHHTGGVFDGVNKGWGDIIPPVADDGVTPVPGGGLNFDEAGAAILENGCEPVEPEEPLTPALAATAETCTTASEGGVLVTITNTGTGGGDVTVTETGGFDSGTVPVAAGTSETVLVPVAEDEAYDIDVVDSEAATVADAPFADTLDCVEDVVVVAPPTQPKVDPIVEPQVAGVSVPKADELPRTGNNPLVAGVGLALLLTGALLLSTAHRLEWSVLASGARHLRR